ncbi:MAG: PIN domain-containing protein [Actinomycetota bacterium]|nr:PIN domain-containing protein [Actinomycetota bacterium]
MDSSILLRVVLGEPARLGIWPKITSPVSSELIRVECLRTIDRARVRLGLSDKEVSRHRSDVLEALDALALIVIDRRVLERASEPFPTVLGSLDAIHLSSAILAREEFDHLFLATHDEQLSMAARAVGFEVEGA